MTADEISATLDATDERTKIAVLAWAFKHLVEHAQDPTTFRHLVYRRLGLGMSAYTPLMNAGGMTISTHFSLMGKAEPAGDSLRIPTLPDHAMMSAGMKALGDVVAMGTTPGVAAVLMVWQDMLRASGRDAKAPAEGDRGR